MAKNATLELLKSSERKYRNAESYANDFDAKEKHFRKISDRKTALVEKIGNVSLFWKNCWFIAAIGVLCLVGFQGFSAKTVIEAIFDPTSQGIIPSWIFVMIGAGISILGMLLGHFLHDSVTIDEHTDEKDFGAMFYLMLVLSVFYIGLQFTLARIGGQDAVAEGEIDYMPYLVAGLGLFEIIIGVFVIEKVLMYVALMYENISAGIKLKGMRSKSRLTNNNYRDYSTFIDAFNATPGIEPKQREGNDNIRRAIAFYAGIQLPPDEAILPTTPVEPINAVMPAPKKNTEHNTEVQQEIEDVKQANPPKNNVSQANTPQVTPTREVTAKEAEEELEAFLEDTVDADLTV